LRSNSAFSFSDARASAPSGSFYWITALQTTRSGGSPGAMDGMDSELANLMPHNLDREGLLASPADTAELREYIQASRGPRAGRARSLLRGARPDGWNVPLQAHAVLGERGNLPQRVDSPSKMRAPDLGARVGTGRAPQAKRFCIRIKRWALGANRAPGCWPGSSVVALGAAESCERAPSRPKTAR
jgi:hypothetical protein